MAAGAVAHQTVDDARWRVLRVRTRRKGQANGTRHRTAAHANADERLHILEAALAEFSRAVEWIDKDGDVRHEKTVASAFGKVRSRRSGVSYLAHASRHASAVSFSNVRR